MVFCRIFIDDIMIFKLMVLVMLIVAPTTALKGNQLCTKKYDEIQEVQERRMWMGQCGSGINIHMG
jgi:hypothetical protein